MAEQPIMNGGIIAAGAGGRLKQAGWMVPKPLVPVAGTPLIERVIQNFLAAGIRSLVIIFNLEEGSRCADWVRSRFPDLDLRILLKTTASSFESFQEVTARVVRERALISTVDAWCTEQDFVAFARAAARYPAQATVLAVTPFVADERPLWARLDASGRVLGFDGESGDMVTAGLYVVPEPARALASRADHPRLRDFLTWLVAHGEPVYGIPIATVVDVDRAEDVICAEALTRRTARPRGGRAEDRR